MRALRIAGAGPAGCAAALAAIAAGAQVEISERSRVPRHKVCGEFLSPETGELLEHLGVWEQFEAARPARMRRMKLHLGRRPRCCTLPEPAFGLSRYALDALLAEAAAGYGARVRRGATEMSPDIAATGRASRAVRGNRLFGFKAHFMGPVDDAVELFFFRGAYAGVSPVENGATNVCCIAPESLLGAHGFDFDAVLETCAPLAGRLRPLSRTMEWLAAGPLAFGAQEVSPTALYTAGDALGFLDPFTGTGVLNALVSGCLAGTAAARGIAPEDRRQVRYALARPFAVAALFRTALGSGWANYLAPFVPPRWLFRLTRPRAAAAIGSVALFPR